MERRRRKKPQNFKWNKKRANEAENNQVLWENKMKKNYDLIKKNSHLSMK